jgi:hypothetical protein
MGEVLRAHTAISSQSRTVALRRAEPLTTARSTSVMPLLSSLPANTACSWALRFLRDQVAHVARAASPSGFGGIADRPAAKTEPASADRCELRTHAASRTKRRAGLSQAPCIDPRLSEHDRSRIAYGRPPRPRYERRPPYDGARPPTARPIRLASAITGRCCSVPTRCCPQDTHPVPPFSDTKLSRERRRGTPRSPARLGENYAPLAVAALPCGNPGSRARSRAVSPRQESRAALRDARERAR